MVVMQDIYSTLFMFRSKSVIPLRKDIQEKNGTVGRFGKSSEA